MSAGRFHFQLSWGPSQFARWDARHELHRCIPTRANHLK